MIVDSLQHVLDDGFLFVRKDEASLLGPRHCCAPLPSFDIYSPSSQAVYRIPSSFSHTLSNSRNLTSVIMRSSIISALVAGSGLVAAHPLEKRQTAMDYNAPPGGDATILN